MALLVLKRADGTGVFFDATLSETHTRKSTVTKFPVEAGASVVDHVRVDPTGLQITAIVGAFPLANGFGQPVSEDRAGRAEDEIDRMQSNVDVLTVLTAKKSYESMVIESVTKPVTAKNAKSLEVSITLVPILTSTSETIAVPKAKFPRGNATVVDGRKTGTDADTPAPALLLQAAQGAARLSGGDAAFAALEKLRKGGG